jgi:hypothetical protein
VCSSPRLIAAYRGLPRLRVPRHPPHAFCRLTPSLECWVRHWPTKPPPAPEDLILEPSAARAHAARTCRAALPRPRVRRPEATTPRHRTTRLRGDLHFLSNRSNRSFRSCCWLAPDVRVIDRCSRRRAPLGTPPPRNRNVTSRIHFPRSLLPTFHCQTVRTAKTARSAGALEADIDLGVGCRGVRLRGLSARSGRRLRRAPAVVRLLVVS